MAARDRFGPFPPDPNTSQLQRFIQRSCDPSNFEPNLALNLEIADLINQKKGNAPREAAVAIVNYINNRNPNVSLLALALLDICVKNCGYPFHLQISTKDFLNELVRRFPERPPIRPSRVQLKILEAIEEWRGTICETSRYKEDLGFIRDMHRLLSYKGYMFPEVRREDAAVLNPSDQLKSAEEMEEEERAAQSAKLQELIRRGTPADLQEANHLMKIMTGYDTKNKTDYRAKAAQDVGKLRQKARLLEEMLQKVKPGENIGQQDVYSELASALKTAQPKIQKMVEEESDDTEAVVKLLELNDMINTILERYTLVKKGDLASASSLPVTAAGTAPSSSAKQQEVSLIDFDNDANGAGPSTGGASVLKAETSLEDDLLGLSFDNSSSSSSNAYGQGGGIALGFGANTSVPGPPLLSSTLQSSTAGNRQIITPSASPAPPPLPTSNYSNFQNFTNPAPAVNAGNNQFSMFSTRTPPPTIQQLQQLQQQERPASQPQLNSHHRNGSESDDWTTFTSALPPSSELPPLKPNEALIVSSNVQIVVEVGRQNNLPDGPVVLKAKFSNPSREPIQDLTFQMAVPKAFQLKMEPQSSRHIPAGKRDAVTQIIRVAGVGSGQGGALRIKWKVSYRLGANQMSSAPPLEEQGVAESLPVS